MTPKTLILALALAWATPLLAADQPVIGSAGPWPADFIKGADISSLVFQACSKSPSSMWHSHFAARHSFGGSFACSKNASASHTLRCFKSANPCS